MTTFIGLAMSDSMFNALPNGAIVTRYTLTPEQVRDKLTSASADVRSCCNASHQATLTALKARFGIEVSAQGAPKVSLGLGDNLIVMQITGLPRLDASRHEYTTEEVASATFTFSVWRVWDEELLDKLANSSFYAF